MEKDKVVGWIGFLVIVLVVLGVAGVVFGISGLYHSSGPSADYTALVAAALFFLQATLAFGFALRSMIR